MKRTDSRKSHVAVYPQHASTPDCENIHDLFEDLWNQFIDPLFSSGKRKVCAHDAAEAIALMQQRIRERLGSGPEGIRCADALLRYIIKRAKKHSSKKRVSLEVFERHLEGEL
jgi:hypothetical protein